MKEKKEQGAIKFSIIYAVLAFLLFCVIIYRMGMLSLSEEVDGINIQRLASNRTVRKETLVSKRGTVFDVRGNALAQNVSSYTLIAYLEKSRTTDPNHPQHVVDVEMTAEKLSTVLDISKEQLIQYMSKDAYQVEFGSKAKNLSELKKDEILALGLPGIDFIETQQRYYPYGNFLSYTLGYATKKDVTKEDGTSSQEIVGEMGIESYCNKELTGENGFTLYQKDRNGYKIAGTQEVTVDAVDGNDVYLTIDSSIQLFVEQAISKLLEKSSLDWLSVMVADAKTGAILASATVPSFDPNKKNIESYLDHNVAYAFEPGSTMKIFSYMAAMEYGVYHGDEKYLSGIFTAKDGTQMGDWYRKGWGYITYDQGFALSSNVAIMTLISKYMTAEQLKTYYNRLGFGSPTGIELPHEASGKVDFKYETEILNAGFGQGITTTPIQNIKALTSIANDGMLLQPYLIDKIVDPNTGKVLYQGGRKEIERVASHETVTKIKELMRSVINGNSSTSTGYYYYMDGYDFIAKTGTAQVPREDGKGYTNETIRGLAGMFPGNDPEVIIYMAIKNPTNGTKPTKEFVQEMIRNISKYLEIYDESSESSTSVKTAVLSSYLDKKKDTVVEELKSLGMDVLVIGNGDTITSQYPSSGVLVDQNDKIFLLTNGSSISMPNVVGYSYREFATLAQFLPVSYSMEGEGYVVSQNIPAGEELKEDSKIEVKLETKY